MKKTCIILGAGGHARVLIDCLQLSTAVNIEGILDPNPALTGTKIYGIPVLGNDELLSEMLARGIDYFVVGVGGTSNNNPRKKLFELALAHGLKPLNIQHPTAIISSKVIIGNGCQLLPGCIVNAGAQLGMNVIVNSGAIVEHDCTIGNHVHIATGAKLTSTIRVGDEAHIGAGATIRQCITIGEKAVIGAGAVVVKNVPANVTVIGIPAGVLKKVSS
jgi:sugar O-acyltransferase (sialic acid O-acetyltransferase NeuD family)